MNLTCRLFVLNAAIFLQVASLLANETSGAKTLPETISSTTSVQTHDQTPLIERATFPADGLIKPYQLELITLGFDAASFMPVNPHVKTRSLLQQDVIVAALGLDQPSLAFRFTSGVEDWRKAYSYAEVAFYLAEHGDLANGRKLVDLADELSKSAEDWRLDRIRVRIAQTYLLLGEPEIAKKITAYVDEIELGKLNQTEIVVGSDDTFTSHVQELDRIYSTRSFEAQQNSTDALILLYGRFYSDAAKRALLEEKVKANLEFYPIILRFDFMKKLATVAARQGDSVNAMSLCAEAQRYIDDYAYFPQDHVRLLAELAEVRHLAGAQEQALQELNSANELFLTEQENIQTMFRGEALRPLAKAYNTLGQTQKAHDVYQLAFEQGFVNPNIRPRSMDFVANCISLAQSGIEPSKELMELIKNIHAELEPAQ